jgi:hypothetical protein
MNMLPALAVMGGLNLATGLLGRKQAKRQAQAQYRLAFLNLTEAAKNTQLQRNLFLARTAEDVFATQVKGLEVKGSYENASSQQLRIRGTQISNFYTNYRPSDLDTLNEFRQQFSAIQARAHNEKLSIFASVPTIAETVVGAALNTMGQAASIYARSPLNPTPGDFFGSSSPTISPDMQYRLSRMP